MTKGVVVVDRWLVPGRDGKRGRKALKPEHERCPESARYLARAFVGGRYVNRTFAGSELAERWAEGAREGTEYVASLSQATVAEVGKAYLDALRNRPGGSASATHIRQVRGCIDGLLGAGADHMDDPSFPDKVRNWLVHMRVKKSYGKVVTSASDGYRSKMLTVTRSLVRYAIDRNLLSRDPTRVIRLARPLIRRRQVFTIEELRRLVCDEAQWMDRGRRSQYEAAVAVHGSQAAAARALDVPLTTLHCRMAADARPDPWWRFAVVVVYTGLRGSEAAAVRWQWIDLARGLIRVPADAPGNRWRRERLCRLQPEFLELLRGPLCEGASPSVPLVGGIAEIAADPQARCQSFRDYMARCGVEAKGRNTHCLRHSMCSLMTALNANHNLVMEAAGHTSADVSRHYADGAREYFDQVETWPRRLDWPEFWLRRPVPVGKQRATVQ